MANNAQIIPFPTNRIVRDHMPAANEALQMRTKKRIINALVDDYAKKIATNIALKGIDINTPGFNAHYSLTIEFLRSSLYKAMGIFHPFQVTLDDVIDHFENNPELINVTPEITGDVGGETLVIDIGPKETANTSRPDVQQ